MKSQFNLSRVKKVAFIKNFNPLNGYPEYGIKQEVKKEVKPTLKTKSIAAKRKKPNTELKNAKKAFKKEFGSNYKAKLLTKSAA